MNFKNVADVNEKLLDAGYIPSTKIATVVFLAAATLKEKAPRFWSERLFSFR